MSRSLTTTADHYDAAAPITARPLSMWAWVNLNANAQNKHILNLSDNSENNRFTLGEISNAATGNGSFLIVAGGTSASQAQTAAALPTGSWIFLGGAVSPSGFTRELFQGSTQTTDTGTITPAGITKFNISGRMVDYGSGLNGAIAHAGLSNLMLDNTEFLWLAAGGNPRGIRATSYWKLNTASGTEIDQIGTVNLSISGTASFASNPNVGSWFTGTAIANQSWTVGTAISNIDFGTPFEDVQSPGTVTFQELGAPSNATTTSGAVTAVKICAVASAAAFSAGDYVDFGGSPTLVMAVSGSNLLVKDAQTYSSGATVRRYAVSPVTFAGVTLNGSNVASGTPTGSGSFTNVFGRWKNNSNATAFADSNLFSVNITAGSGAPWTAGPSFNSANTDGYTLGYTPGVTGTVYAVALVKGSAVPTPALVHAGTPTGLVARFSKACTSGTADTISLTGLTNPIHDIHIINNGGSDSAVTSFLAKQKLPAAGRAYITITGALTGTSPFGSVTPAVAVNDIIDYVATVGTNSYIVSTTSTGDVEIDSGGDESRDLIAFNIYDDDVGAMYYTADSTFAVNDLPPVSDSGLNNAFLFFLPANQTIAAVNFADPTDPLMTSPAGDAVNYHEVSSVLAAAGLSITGNQLQGTTTNVNQTLTVVVGGVDPYGSETDVTGLLVIGDVVVPDCTGLFEAQGVSSLGAVYLTEATPTQAPSAEPVGTIISQTPAANTTVAPNTTVTFTLAQAMALPTITPSGASDVLSAGLPGVVF